MVSLAPLNSPLPCIHRWSLDVQRLDVSPFVSKGGHRRSTSIQRRYEANSGSACVSVGSELARSLPPILPSSQREMEPGTLSISPGKRYLLRAGHSFAILANVPLGFQLSDCKTVQCA